MESSRWQPIFDSSPSQMLKRKPITMLSHLFLGSSSWVLQLLSQAHRKTQPWLELLQYQGSSKASLMRKKQVMWSSSKLPPQVKPQERESYPSLWRSCSREELILSLKLLLSKTIRVSSLLTLSTSYLFTPLRVRRLNSTSTLFPSCKPSIFYIK